MSEGDDLDQEAVERVVRIEAKQDHIVEKVDQIHDRIEGDVDEIDSRLESVERKTRRLWLFYSGLKWLGGTAGLLAIVVTQITGL